MYKPYRDKRAIPPRRVYAPFTVGMIDRINAQQSSGQVVTLVCTRSHNGQNIVLIAKIDGLHCSVPGCNYKQNWAIV